MSVVDRTIRKAPIVVVDHPLARTKLSVLRAKTTPMQTFRENVQELSMLLLLEAARNWQTTPVPVETPLRKCNGDVLSRPVVLVPILRAGLGMLEGMLRFVPDAGVGHLGVYRDEQVLRPVTYFSRLPSGLTESQVVLIDPMLATGHSACLAVSVLKEQGAGEIQFVCIISCRAGLDQLQSVYPDVEIITAAVDPELNDFGFIVPGLGDAGDRYFGTT
jgi:uracil phosphoribosyltransferase